MPFCTNCGHENPPDVRFCGACGTEQFSSANVCPKCGKAFDENEKFCSACGTPSGTGAEANKQEKTPVGQPAPSHTVSRPKKKRRGCLGCFFQSIFVLLVIVVVGIGVKFILGKISSTSFRKSDSVEIINPGDKNDLVVPGGDTKKKEKPFESPELKDVTAKLEAILENADIEKFKLMLSESALEKYAGELDQLKPDLPAYGKAFKKRELVTSSTFFKVYEFTGDDGTTYTATFEFQPGDTWKLVRF